MQCYDFGVVGTGPLGLVAAQALSAISSSVLLLGPKTIPNSQAHIALSRQTLLTFEKLRFPAIWFLKTPDLDSLSHPLCLPTRFSPSIRLGLIRSLILGVEGAMGWRVEAEHADFLGVNISQDCLQRYLWEGMSPQIFHKDSLLKMVVQASQEGYLLTDRENNIFHVKKLVAADGMLSQVRRNLMPKWDVFKKSSVDAQVFLHKPLEDAKSFEAYQVASKGGVLASLPISSHEDRYGVWTGQGSFPWDLPHKTIPLWNYSVGLDSIEDCAYIGLAGQSWDPNAASGMNLSIAEVLQLQDLWAGPQIKKFRTSWIDSIQKRRSVVRSLIQKNRQVHALSLPIPKAILRAELEMFTGQPLELTRCLCPSVLL